MEEKVEITKKQLDYFNERDDMLSALEQAGVDNWTGWDYAMDILREMNNE